MFEDAEGIYCSHFIGICDNLFNYLDLVYGSHFIRKSYVLCDFTFSLGRQYTRTPYMTFHHEMSCNMPDGHFMVIFSERKFYAVYNSENHFQIRGLVAELHVFEYGDRAFSTFKKLDLNVEDFHVKTIGWG